MVSGANKQISPRVITTSFGDGYKSDVPDGLNTALAGVQLQFMLTPTEADAFEVFLQSHVGKPFLYQLPNASVNQVWVWTQMQRQPTGGATWETISVTFEERVQGVYSV
jgi:phage-related protein